MTIQILENDETIDHPQPDGDGIRVGEEDGRAPKKTVQHCQLFQFSLYLSPSPPTEMLLV